MPATLEAPKNFTPPPDRLVTGAELLQHPEWGPCELIRGKVVPVCRPNNEHGLLVTRLAIRIGNFVERQSLGRCFSGDLGVYLGRDPDTVRGPDLHFLRAASWPGKAALKGYLETAPDLCVEVVSPNDQFDDVEEKVHQYLAIGVKLVWVIAPKMRTAFVYRASQVRQELTLGENLSGEDVLPGFELPLKELFAVLD